MKQKLILAVFAISLIFSLSVISAISLNDNRMSIRAHGQNGKYWEGQDLDYWKARASISLNLQRDKPRSWGVISIVEPDRDRIIIKLDRRAEPYVRQYNDSAVLVGQKAWVYRAYKVDGKWIRTKDYKTVQYSIFPQTGNLKIVIVDSTPTILRLHDTNFLIAK